MGGGRGGLAEQAGGDPRVADAYAIAAHEAWHRGEHDRGGELAQRGHAAMDACGERPYYLLAILAFQALHRGAWRVHGVGRRGAAQRRGRS